MAYQHSGVEGSTKSEVSTCDVSFVNDPALFRVLIPVLPWSGIVLLSCRDRKAYGLAGRPAGPSGDETVAWVLLTVSP